MKRCTSTTAVVVSLTLLAGVVAVSSPLAGRKSTSFTVSSSLDGKTVLPLRSHWIAYPKVDPAQAQVSEVDYLIDGYHAWTAHSAPWYYGDNGNWFVTSILKPGLHNFTVRALTADNQVAIDKFQARVLPAPNPPAKLAGRWQRGTSGTLWIAKNGWTIHPNAVVDARYLPNGSIVLGPQIIDRPEQTPDCGSNPPQIWKATIAAGDKRMTLAPVGKDACGIRVTVFKGIWTRTH
jgi:hypothetical protein